jgi:ribonuclease T1
MRHSLRRIASRFFVAISVATLCASAVGIAGARTASCALDESVSAKDLPQQGKETLILIQSGGPFPHDRDGVTFSNRERILPKERRGYYREYTVRTPGVKHRGAQRIVCGGDQRKADQCYYSADHYKTFKCIAR